MKHKYVSVVLIVLLTILMFFLSVHTSDTFVNNGHSATQKNTSKKTKQKINHFCAPNSTIYLTQEQQEYKLGKRGQDTPDVVDAKSHGAKAKVTLRVVDSRGNPVPDANVIVAYFHRGEKLVEGQTDADGFFTAESMSGSDVHFHAFKEGYYRTYRNYWFYREGQACAENGCWLPWNPTLEVVMKEIRSPAGLPTKQTRCHFPVGVYVGFDCEKNQLVEPYGTGVFNDLTVMVNGYSIAPTNYSFNLFLTADNGGYIRKIKESYSDMWSVYEAPEFEKFKQNLTASIKYKYNTVLEDTRFNDNEYIIFSSRVKHDNDGKIISANYGKIKDGIKFNIQSANTNMATMIFSYQFNIVPNNRNLE